MPKLTMTTAQALALTGDDFYALSDAQQKAVTRQLIDIAHKRFQRGVKEWGEMGALGEYAKETAKRSKVGKTIQPMQRGKQSIAGKTGKQLYREFQIAQHFLTQKTSTEKGRMDVKTKFEKTMGMKLTRPEYVKLWDVYDKLETLAQNGVIDTFQIKYEEVLKQIYSKVHQKTQSADEIVNEIVKQMTGIYEQSVEEQHAWDIYLDLQLKEEKTDDDIELLQRLSDEYGFGDSEFIW